jgi:hypothetical protein
VAQGHQDYYNYDTDGNANYYVAKEVNDMCGALYTTSGKCETNVDPEELRLLRLQRLCLCG